MKNQLTLITLLLTGCLASVQTGTTMTDSRDRQTYKTVSYEDPLLGAKITIMAENLNYKIAGSYAYDNNEQYRKNLGLLYTWEAAKKACPSGWHLPSDSEWSRLVALIGSKYTVGNIMKSTKGWVENGNGTNRSGFNAMPAGYFSYNGKFYAIGMRGHFWSSSEKFKTGVWCRSLGYYSSEVYRSNYGKYDAFSCRCIRD